MEEWKSLLVDYKCWLCNLLFYILVLASVVSPPVPSTKLQNLIHDHLVDPHPMGCVDHFPFKAHTPWPCFCTHMFHRDPLICAQWQTHTQPVIWTHLWNYNKSFSSQPLLAPSPQPNVPHTFLVEILTIQQWVHISVSVNSCAVLGVVTFLKLFFIFKHFPIKKDLSEYLSRCTEGQRLCQLLNLYDSISVSCCSMVHHLTAGVDAMFAASSVVVIESARYVHDHGNIITPVISSNSFAKLKSGVF